VNLPLFAEPSPCQTHWADLTQESAAIPITDKMKKDFAQTY